MTTDTLPQFFKDADGFCYVATPILAASGLTPWDGAVDERGYAVEAQDETPAARTTRRAKAPAAE